MTRKMSENMKARWANPEWAARQRKRISEGMKESPHVIDASQRAARTRAQRGVGVARAPFIELSQSHSKPYDPIRDNPRLRELLRGDR